MRVCPVQTLSWSQLGTSDNESQVGNLDECSTQMMSCQRQLAKQSGHVTIRGAEDDPSMTTGHYARAQR